MSIEQLIIIPVSIISFLILLSFIVFFHEYGHFSIARLCGVRVDAFSIGFGKPLLRWIDKKGTEWRIASIPLGGYVKFFGDANAASQPDPALGQKDMDVVEGERGEGEQPKPMTTQFPSGAQDEAGSSMTPEERAVCFHFKPVWARAAIVAAGPLTNFILAIVIFSALLMIFGRGIQPAVVGSVVENSAAEEAGFQVGDRITSINGKAIDSFSDISRFVQLSSGDTLKIIVERGGESVSLTAVPRREEIIDPLGNKVKSGRLGIGSSGDVQFEKYGPIKAVGTSAEQVVNIIGSTLKFISRLVVGKESAEQLGGPVKMAKYAGQAASTGFSDRVAAEASFGDRLQISLINWINLAAVISVSIGFLNLLPIPVLDGGHLMYYGFEVVVGRPVGAKAQMLGYQVGLALLLSFMVFVTWNDISGLFRAAFS